MTNHNCKPKILEWDTNHFGVKIASFAPLNESDVIEGVKWARDNAIQLLMGRCDTSDIKVINSMEKANFLLMETLVCYKFDFLNRSVPEAKKNIPIRSILPKDIKAIGEISKTAFKDFIDHFHRDPKLNQEKCDALYEQWAINSYKDKNLAERIIIADDRGKVLGFQMTKRVNEEVAEGGLAAIDLKSQGRGIYTSLLINAMQWCKEKGFKKMEVKTQIPNYKVQRIWQRHGFEINSSLHTLHLWL